MSCLIAHKPTYLQFKTPDDDRIDKKFMRQHALGLSPNIGHQAVSGLNQNHLRYPEFSCHHVRLTSFDRWPRQMQQRPCDLAAAGFFYTGTRDEVKCFTCGGILHNWELNDDPFTEHAKWFPECQYIVTLVGGKYISQSSENLKIQRYNVAERQSDITNITLAPAFVETTTSQGSTSIPKSLNTLNTTLEYNGTGAETPVFHRVLEMGYSAEMVNFAVEQCKLKGNTIFSARDLLEVIFEIEDSPELKKSLYQKKNHSNEHDNKKTPSLKEKYYCEQKENENDTGKNTYTNGYKVACLEEQNRELKERTLCKICLENNSCIVFLPCGHLVTCTTCSRAVKYCPVCRKYIQGTVKAYIV